MNELENICPKCQTGRTELKGGQVYCPNCGFEGEEKKSRDEAAAMDEGKVRSRLWLYFALIVFVTPLLVLLLQLKELGEAAIPCGMTGLFAASCLVRQLYRTASPKTKDQMRFWLSLFSPAFVSLLTFWLGGIDPLGPLLAIGSLCVALIASFYCGAWLADHCFPSTRFPVLLRSLCLLGIGFVNLMVIIGGCTQVSL